MTIMHIKQKADQTTPEYESIFSPLNSKYTFDHFVVGDSNRLAYEAAKAAADNPANVYNPLFIYGDVAQGTTHLLNAIGHSIQKSSPELLVCYCSAEKFMHNLVDHLRSKDMDTFRKLHRDVDVFLIDEIDFLSGKTGTQEELINTIKALYEAKKQIVIGARMHPNKIPDFDKGLRSLFLWGLTAEIKTPDLKTKLYIIQKKVEAMGISIPSDVISFLAAIKRRNIRELEGMLILLEAFSRIQNIAITLDMAKEKLRDIISYPDMKIKMAFDIGGVLGKYPNVFRPMVSALQKGGAEVFVLTDITDIKVAQEQLSRYEYIFSPEMILCADFEKYGERCKSVLIKEYGIDVLIDDHPGYCADSGCVSLFVWPDPLVPYESIDKKCIATNDDTVP